mmetsp:Transcript_151312/g.263749  ORF Transcript_151312/g.263749 Transcript_151312/m.263749 type:complete len:83 (-) Transcript_151312:975-1223(-)
MGPSDRVTSAHQHQEPVRKAQTLGNWLRALLESPNILVSFFSMRSLTASAERSANLSSLLACELPQTFASFTNFGEEGSPPS